MAAALDNANPTILSASQLPTRGKRATPRKGPDSKYAEVILSKPCYLSRPFYQGEDDELQVDAAWPRLNVDAEDFVAADPIDEQEIYGTYLP